MSRALDQLTLSPLGLALRMAAEEDSQGRMLRTLLLPLYPMRAVFSAVSLSLPPSLSPLPFLSPSLHRSPPLSLHIASQHPPSLSPSISPFKSHANLRRYTADTGTANTRRRHQQTTESR